MLGMPAEHRLPLVGNQNWPAPAMTQAYALEGRMEIADALFKVSKKVSGVAIGPDGALLVATRDGDRNGLVAYRGW